jgi:5-formyltetrahydrofolate cyclo-ligase
VSDVRPARDGVADRRRRLDHEEVAAASAAVADRVLDLLAAHPPGGLGSYAPTDGEVDPAPAASVLRAAGWSVWLPVAPAGPPAPMSFRRWDATDPPPPGRFGIPTPPDGSPESPADHLAVVLVPLVVFGPGGRRAGRGFGYYDRTFAGRLRADRPAEPLLVGLAHDFQEVGAWATNPWDVPLDVVVTPTRTLAS